ncbi:hypothetical protein ACFQWH_24940 [Mycolicibacterium sp. GCM10028919]|uniref:hypothetical protein n=1 Tax=Mycolicibacterium sp. GCM10028919 TaxID=3273401 RepID=UPI00361D63A1
MAGISISVGGHTALPISHPTDDIRVPGRQTAIMAPSADGALDGTDTAEQIRCAEGGHRR